MTSGIATLNKGLQLFAVSRNSSSKRCITVTSIVHEEHLYESVRGAAPAVGVAGKDDPRARRALAAILKGWGCTIRTAETAEQAIALLAAVPALVVLDLMLPDVSGVEVLRHIRAERLDLLVAVVSGAKDEMLAEAQALQPDAVFEKPLSLMKLSEWLAAGTLATCMRLPRAAID